MVETQDLDVLKDIPGYKAILKALIKSQIQHLVEQLSSHTEEECVLLSASLCDGSLSHLGSDFGKKFLDDHDDVKKQFLGFCLKKQLMAPTPSSDSPSHLETSASSYTQEDQATGMEFKQRRNRFGQTSSRPRLAAAPYGNYRTHRQSPVNPKFTDTSTLGSSPGSTLSHPTYSPAYSQQGQSSTLNHPDTPNVVNTDTPSDLMNQGMKYEGFGEVSLVGHSDGVTLAGSQSEQFGSTEMHPQMEAGSSVTDNGDNKGTSNEDGIIVKLEPADDDESDLEITGVDLNKIEENNWGFGTQTTAAADQSFENVAFATDFEISQNAGNLSEAELTEGLYKSVHKFANNRPTRSCPVCGKMFPSCRNLKTHLRTHTGEKPHSCPYCNRMFTDKSNLNRHVKTKHILF